MRRFSAILLLLFSLSTAGAAEPVRIVFDTDIGNDIDDALALAILHALESRGEAKLLAVTITKDNRWAAPYIDLVDTFYGRPDIPVGMVAGGKTPEDSKLLMVPCQAVRPDGKPLYPRRLKDGSEAPEAVGLLRRILSKENDGAVTMVQVGFSTNLSRLLDSKPDDQSPLAGRELVTRKVRLLVTMAGQFPTGPAEYNVKTDLAAAQKLFTSWPTPLVTSGFEIGDAMLFPAARINHDFAYAPHHPIADAYRAYMPMPYDRQTWDLTAALYAVRPDRGYFSLSGPGAIKVDPEGKTHFTRAEGGLQRYLVMNDLQRAKTLEAMIELASQPPQRTDAAATAQASGPGRRTAMR